MKKQIYTKSLLLDLEPSLAQAIEDTLDRFSRSHYPSRASLIRDAIAKGLADINNQLDK